MSSFKKAVKVKLNGRLALCGVSGSGKTLTALKIARGMSPTGQIAVIDSERGSASKYADMFDFNVLELDSFHPNTYIKAIADAKGHDVLIIDSLSHAWMGKDGALEQVDRAAARTQSKNTFAAWRDVTPLHNSLIDAILAFPGHIIVTMRSKSDYVMETNEKGRSMPVKVGLAPIQREGVEYEFDLVADMNIENTMVVTKTRDPQFRQAVISMPTEKVGEDFASWLNSGTEPQKPVEKQNTEECPILVALPPIDEKERTNRRKWRATVNNKGKECQTLEDIAAAVKMYEETLKEFFDAFTYHNETETYRSLLAVHAARIQDELTRKSPEGIAAWIATMKKATTQKDFADFVAVYARNDYLHTDEVEIALEEVAGDFELPNWRELIKES